MRKTSALKLGFGLLAAVAMMLGATSANAGVCPYQYTHNGHLCTLVSYDGGCCHYTDGSSAAVCPPICI
jgi:hypothetical protein